MQPGESPAAAAGRLLQREYGLALPPDRFAALCANSMVWDRREQPPAGHGVCDISVVLVVTLTEAEAAAGALDAGEFEDSRWAAVADVARAAGAYHPVLVRCAREYEAARALSEVEALVRGAARAAPDAAPRVVELMRRVFELRQMPEGIESYRVRRPEMGYEAGVAVEAARAQFED